MNLLQKIDHLRPCPEAGLWLSDQKSAKGAWNTCERGDWMLWLLGNLSGPPEDPKRKKLVLCACQCARLALPHTKDKRVEACIVMAEKWSRGEATIEQLREAHIDAAADAADDAADAYAADAAAANAAAYAAYAADAAAANAADAYAAAAYAAAATHAARSTTLAKCADIVRNFYPNPPTIKKEKAR